jgi:hypothetical protein
MSWEVKLCRDDGTTLHPRFISSWRFGSLQGARDFVLEQTGENAEDWEGNGEHWTLIVSIPGSLDHDHWDIYPVVTDIRYLRSLRSR